MFSLWSHVIGSSRGDSEGPIQTYCLCWCHLSVIWVTPRRQQLQFCVHTVAYMHKWYPPVVPQGCFYSLSKLWCCSPVFSHGSASPRRGLSLLLRDQIFSHLKCNRVGQSIGAPPRPPLWSCKEPSSTKLVGKTLLPH